MNPVKTLQVDGLKVAELRERKGWTQHTTGRRAGISRALVSAIEGGDRQPSAQVAKQLAEALGCDLDALLVDS